MDEAYESLNLAGVELFLNGKYEQAIPLLEAAVESMPNPESLRTIGECYRAMGRNKDAILYLAASLGLSENSKAYLLLAEALFDYGALFPAQKAASKAIKILPHYNAAKKLLQQIEKAQMEANP